MAWLQELGDKIRKARRQADLSQQELAKSLSVSRGKLSNYENGKCPANVNVITEIAEALGTEFIVRGYRIARNNGRQTPLVPLAEQLSLAFDVEHRFPGAALTIRPSKESILITAIVPRRAKSG